MGTHYGESTQWYHHTEWCRGLRFSFPYDELALQFKVWGLPTRQFTPALRVSWSGINHLQRAKSSQIAHLLRTLRFQNKHQRREGAAYRVHPNASALRMIAASHLGTCCLEGLPSIWDLGLYLEGMSRVLDGRAMDVVSRRELHKAVRDVKRELGFDYTGYSCRCSASTPVFLSRRAMQLVETIVLLEHQLQIWNAAYRIIQNLSAHVHKLAYRMPALRREVGRALLATDALAFTLKNPCGDGAYLSLTVATPGIGRWSGNRDLYQLLNELHQDYFTNSLDAISPYVLSCTLPNVRYRESEANHWWD